MTTEIIEPFVIYVIEKCIRIYAKILKLIIILAQRAINTGERTFLLCEQISVTQQFSKVQILERVSGGIYSL